MQLEAFVWHNCLDYRDLPFGMNWRVDEHDVIVPDLPPTDPAYPAALEHLHRWLRDNCQYGALAATRAELTDAPRLNAFIAALDNTSGSGFPFLRNVLQMTGNRQTQPPEALAILDELTAFRKLAHFGESPFLVNSTTMENVQQHNPDADGLFYTASSGTALGVDQDGFFIRQNDETIFRAIRLFQAIKERDENDVPTQVEFTNVATGALIRTDAPISGEMILWDSGALQNERGYFRFDYPAELHVETRTLGAETYAYIVVPLARLCELAVETGTPIHWHIKGA